VAEPDPLFPTEPIAAWLDAQGIAPGQPIEATRLAGGLSNAMFRVQRGDRRFVLRRPAKVAIERADDGMRREFRVLSALAGTDVPHPEAVALCDDTTVIGCAFYLMGDVAGIPPMALPADPEVRREATLAVTDALAALHGVEWRDRLDGFGRPDDFHQRQVGRWTRQYDGYGTDRLPGVRDVGGWLEAHLPTDWSPTIIHADYHMMNLLVSDDRPVRVTAILDWETATIGDPLLDLAGFTEIWCSAFQGDGWPTRGEIVDRYARQRGLGDVPDLRYYDVLYNFRLAILLEGVYQRSRLDGSRPDDAMAADRSMANITRALELAR
jgi:aminoglycoside phosphotransferase (APT) family kinase protein